MLFGEQNSEDMPSPPVSRSTSSSSSKKGTLKVRTKTRRRKKQAILSSSSPLRRRTTAVEKGTHLPPLPSDAHTMYKNVWKNLGFIEKSCILTPSTCFEPICVTGVDGFAASWIVAELLKSGYHVRGTVQNSKDEVSALLDLPHARERLHIIEASLLTPESCDVAVEGCKYVIHTGTPSSCAVRDPLSEAQAPGVHSIGSRLHCIIPMMTNFIQACARAKIEKLILTSSTAAMADSAAPPHIIKDNAWNTKSSLERNPHFTSLKLAEEAAWQLVEQLPKDHKFQLVSINPGTLMGPVLCGPKIPPGNQVIYDLITGVYSALVDLNWAMVDVRDCAKAHVKALEDFSARGRFICVNETVWMQDLVNFLGNNGYSGRDLPWQFGLPNWVARLPSYASQLGQVGASLYGHESGPSVYQNAKIVQSLNMSFISAEKTVKSSADNLLSWGLIKPWDEDHESTHCKCCESAFTFYRRKHHCRDCGVIICALCSQSRAVVEGLDDRARLCDLCVKNSVPELLALLRIKHQVESRRTSVIALESLMANPLNHELVTRTGGIPLILAALHVSDRIVADHAAGTILALSCHLSSALQLVLEGAVLQMLEVDDKSSTWRIALSGLRNIWRQVNRPEFRQMLFAVARVSSDAAIGALRGNIILTFVHMMEGTELVTLLPEGLLSVLLVMLQSTDIYPRCAAAHAIKHMIPTSYRPDTTIDVPPYIVDDHGELLSNTALSDIQFLVKDNISPINAHKVVLFFRNSYFKNMFGSGTSTKSTIEVNNVSHAVFYTMLSFLYTGRVHIENSTAAELLEASSLYQVLELQKRAEEYLASEINVDNVIDLLHLANSTYAEDLKRICIAFLMKNIHQAVRLSSFKEHRIWAGEEVLCALCSILGPEWDKEYIKTLESSRTPPSPLSLSTKHADSPLRQSLLNGERHSIEEENTSMYDEIELSSSSMISSPGKRFRRTSLSHAEDNDEDEHMIRSLGSVGKEKAQGLLSTPHRSHCYSDEMSDRSEGIC